MNTKSVVIGISGTTYIVAVYPENYWYSQQSVRLISMVKEQIKRELASGVKLENFILTYDGKLRCTRGRSSNYELRDATQAYVLCYDDTSSRKEYYMLILENYGTDKCSCVIRKMGENELLMIAKVRGNVPIVNGVYSPSTGKIMGDGFTVPSLANVKKSYEQENGSVAFDRTALLRSTLGK